ncbi:MAG TPA: ATP-binding protein [Ramlibacter sp.]|nr:ATP-binding protein [Ramlibacter sp.]
MALDRDRFREMFPGKTRMHAWMREFDWDASWFGSPASWPKSLRGIVSLMLDSAFPMCLAWGPDLRLFYNDSYLSIAEQQHPVAFGAPMQDAWAEFWPAMEPSVMQAFGGESGFFENFPVDVIRYGRPARRWFNFSCTPVRDDEGHIAGVACIGSESTELVLMERHHAFQLQVSEHLGGFSDPDRIAADASRMLGEHLGLARVGYLEVDDARQTFSARSDWSNGASSSPAGEDLAIGDWMMQLRSGQIITVDDSVPREASAAASPGASRRPRSMLAVPLTKGGELCAVLHLHRNQPQGWSEHEIALAREMAERIWAAIARAKANERRRLAESELRTNAARLAFQLELADLLRPLTDADAIIAAASSLLGRHLGVCRVLYAEVDAAKGRFEVRRDWTAPGVPSVAGNISRMDDFGPDIIVALKSGATVAVDDIEQDARTAPHAAAYASVGVRAFITVPLVKSGRLDIVLILHRQHPFAWSEFDLERARDTAERTWSAVEAAQAQAALRAERDRNRYVLDSMGEGFALLGPDCTLLQINAEGLRIGRLSRAQTVGRKAGEIWPNAGATALGGLYRQVKTTGQAGSLEYKLTVPDGRPYWIEVRAYPALGGGMAIFYRDIDQRKKAEEKLKLADRRKDEFVAKLAHELRNPIAPIAAAAAVLSMPGLSEADVQRAGDIISRQAGFMTGLVNELLDIARITSGVVDLHPSDLDINEIVPEAVEQAEPLIKSHAHHLEVRLAGQSPRVWGDHQRLVQVLANLLNNAAKYTPNGGKIVLQVRAEEDYVVVCVEDNGMGMPADLVETAFELFARGQRSPDRTEGGLGIGLALVKGIVELHGGTVTAHSDGPGRGSEFRVLLPRLAKRGGQSVD